MKNQQCLLSRGLRIHRPSSEELTWFALSPQGKSLQTRRRKLITLTMFVSPSTIPEGPSPYMKIHPMVAVLPKRAPTDRKKRTFSEENEGCCFWPVYVGRESAEDRRTLV
jgi:hypothetical protein